MLLPARTAVLNYLYGVESADVAQIMESLKPRYGGERPFTKQRPVDVKELRAGRTGGFVPALCHQ